MNKRPIEYRHETRTVKDLLNLFQDKELNLSPGFQRQSVWHERDRVKLIDSILRNYPVPAIFLYHRECVFRTMMTTRFGPWLPVVPEHGYQ